MPGINGWYYDTQLNNKLTSVTLHSNKWYDKTIDNGTYKDGVTKKRSGGFKNWNQIEGDNGFGPNGNATDDDRFATHAGVTDTGDGSGYGIDPICKSILAEDFNVTISNTWSEFGGDPVQELWNGARVKYAPYAKNIIETLGVLAQKNEEARQNENNGNITSWITNLISKLSNGVQNLTKDMDIVRFLNKALISQGTRFSYYGGTGISFGNLGMRFTLFPKWDEYGDFITVTDQVSKLYPYFIGRLEKFEEVDTILKKFGDTTTNGDPKFYDFLQKCFMWQSPPNDYKAEIFDIDVTQEGTLKLKFGCQYELANLLCTDMMLNFSKGMVKSPKDNTLSPLYCDIALNLRPATKFTDLSLKKFIGGLNNSGGAKKDLTELNNMLNKNLNDQEKEFDNMFGKTSLKTSYLN